MNADPNDLISSLATLNRIAEALNAADDMTAALRTALANLVQLMGMKTGWIFLRDPAARNQWFGPDFSLAASYNLPASLRPDKAAVWKGGCECQTLCKQGATGQPYNQVLCSRLSELPRAERDGLAVHATAWLRSGNQVLGILNVAAGDWREFTPEALALLQNAGSLIGIALERAHLYDLLREQHIQEHASLVEFSNRMLMWQQPSELLNFVVEEMVRLLHVDAAALIMPGEAGAPLYFRAATGWRSTPEGKALPIVSDEFNIFTTAMRSQQPFLINELEAHMLPLYELDWLHSEQFHGLAVMPLLVDGPTRGLLILATRRPQTWSDDMLRFLRLMANQTALALDGLRLHQQEMERQRLQEELGVARTIQLSMLPKQLPQIAGWQVASVYLPADMVGGDFYDFFTLPGDPSRLGLLIGDVADKGVPAALFMALSRTLLRSTALSGRGPAAALLRANHLILNDSQNDLFLSAFYAALEPATGRMVFANAGHVRPLWWRARQGRVQELRGRGIILGAFEEITIAEHRLTVQPGDTLLFYTDGLSEATDAHGEMLDAEALAQWLLRHGSLNADDLSAALLATYTRHTAGNEQRDDLTFFVIKRLDTRRATQ